ncbi:Ribokinase-like protein [Dacryopinax primogenitus]|uniref:Ribokinase n=1 Tax=Dacryopinax primogenitus (strain DJM 731) TaxID=1858805 RepID=M5G0C5_DACPD|nr:Ribokinase-like protein [Dacryopinax primogenitus]EJU01595.1 Ribokinase-like protein [Dacryopinax primogenitus]
MAGTCLVRGSINIDEFFRVPHIAHAGETLSSTGELTRRAGGKGANQAAAIARAGGNVQLVGAVGTDGDWVKQQLSEAGVDVKGVHIHPEISTGRAIIQLTPEGTNHLALHPPSYHLAPPITHLLLQNEILQETTLEFLKYAKEKGIRTIYNPSPLLPKEEIAKFPWGMVDYLLLNEHEAAALADATAPHAHAHSLPPTSKAPQIATVLTRLQQPLFQHCTVILTLGGQGVVAHISKDEIYYLPAATLRGTVRDSTGAGDCFTGYFVEGLLSGREKEQDGWKGLLRRCVVAAGMCVERSGAMGSIPTAAEVDERLNELGQM